MEEFQVSGNVISNLKHFPVLGGSARRVSITTTSRLATTRGPKGCCVCVCLF